MSINSFLTLFCFHAILVDKTEEITHINNLGPYITSMLEIDAFFLNEDRHTNNIAVIYDENQQQYSLSPLLTRDFVYLQT